MFSDVVLLASSICLLILFIVHNILRWDKGNSVFSKIVQELNAVETRLRLQKADSEKELFDVQNNQIQKTSRKIKCWACRKLGYTQSNCYSKIKSDFHFN